MKVINIGRGHDNDVVLNNPKISRNHCRIYAKGRDYYLVDLESKNGTYVNGRRITVEHRLADNDKVVIGSERIPWQSYVNKYMCMEEINRTPVRKYDHNYAEPIQNESEYSNPPEDLYNSNISGSEDKQPNGLGLAALLLSLVGAGLLLFSAIKIIKWGIFGWMGKASTYMISSLVISVVVWVLALIANSNDYKDSDMADIAEGIASFCLFAIIGFFIYVKFINTNAFNPFL